MVQNSILLQNVSTEQLVNLIDERTKILLTDLKKDLLDHKANDDLLTRKQACEFLQINSSTLWHWTNKGRVVALGIANRRYYKRSELLEALNPLKK